MGSEVVQFLKIKFINAVQEEDKDQTRVPLYTLFQEIGDILENEISSETTTSSFIPAEQDLYDLNDAFIECQIISDNRNNSKQGTLSRYSSLTQYFFLGRIKKRLLDIKAKLLQGITKDADLAVSRPSILQPTPPTRQISLTSSNSKIYYGFEDQMNKIVELLQLGRIDGFKAIGIVGMGGSGKTSLAQLVFNSKIAKKDFRPRIWIPLSKTSDQVDVPKEIVKSMLKGLGEDELQSSSDTTSLDDLMHTLHRHLSGKKYLIVLDDVWDTNHWYKDLDSKLLLKEDKWGDRLAYGLPKDYGGGVIVTSRLEQVATWMVGHKENLYPISPLPRESCWSIFKDTTKNEGIDLDHRSFTSVAKKLARMEDEIKEKCDGLPSAAKTLGEIISKHITYKGIAFLT